MEKDLEVLINGKLNISNVPWQPKGSMYPRAYQAQRCHKARGGIVMLCTVQPHLEHCQQFWVP